MEDRRLIKAKTPRAKFSFMRGRDGHPRTPSQKRSRDSTGSDARGKRQRLNFEAASTSVTVSDPLATYKMMLRTEGEMFEVQLQDGVKGARILHEHPLLR
ncbi:uncharacterized protein LOC118425844 isoform X2 [Branchiostoma floridae]|uniref:Uncharacterized protein LOC118425844 isoform X2 n=1 Tax=Branchiostoma floridae TaxID=7739 RepID=A0A9J7M0G9_BRAFL|nr:uncharacterized protein LOC118425844 isoform X2 [Branchiostoma floridae]